MDYRWFDLVGNIGVLLMVVAYLLLQLEKMSSSAVTYLFLNALGATLVISLYGLAKPLFSKRAA